MDIRKSRTEIIRIEANRYRGFYMAAIRVWAELDDGRLVPTKKGCTFRRDLIPQIIKALEAIRDGETEPVEPPVETGYVEPPAVDRPKPGPLPPRTPKATKKKATKKTTRPAERDGVIVSRNWNPKTGKFED